MSFVVCNVSLSAYPVLYICRNTNLQKVCSSSLPNVPVVKILYSCRTSVFHIVSHPGWLAEHLAAKRISLLKFCKITGSAVALHCGKAHVQSQWERANFDPQLHHNPWNFSNLNLTAMIRSLVQCKFAIQAIQRGFSQTGEHNTLSCLFFWLVSWLCCILLGHSPWSHRRIDFHGLWLIWRVFAEGRSFWWLRQYRNSFGVMGLG